MKARLRTLQYGRFAAASIVVVNHTINLSSGRAAPGMVLFGGWNPQGGFGVEYFFVLSGFVMMLAHGDDFGALLAAPRFWWRRVCRIYPVYWLVLVIAVVMYRPVLSGAGWVGLLSLVSPEAAHMISPAWTLRYEVAFYLVFGLGLLPVVGRAVLAAWVVLLVWSIIPGWAHDLVLRPIRHQLTHFLLYHSGLLGAPICVLFVAGMAAALVYRRTAARGWMGAGLVVAGVLGLVACGRVTSWYAIYSGPAGMLGVGGGFAALILGLAMLERAGWLGGGRLAGWLGDMSYPLYLLHIPLQEAALRFVGGAPHLGRPALYLLVAAGLVLAYAGAALVTVLFDRPVRRWLLSAQGRW